MDRALVVESGMVDERLEFVMDQDLILRLALIRPPLYVDYPVVLFRTHSGSKSSLRNARRAREKLLIAHKLFSREDLPPEIWKVRRKSLAIAHQYAWQCYAEADRHGLALWHLLNDIFYAPRGGNWRKRQEVIKKAISNIFCRLRSLEKSKRFHF